MDPEIEAQAGDEGYFSNKKRHIFLLKHALICYNNIIIIMISHQRDASQQQRLGLVVQSLHGARHLYRRVPGQTLETRKNCYLV